MFQSYCSKCRKTVPVQLLVSDNDLELALDNNTEIKVKHTVSGDDHVWILSDQDLDNLIKVPPSW
jgi:Holliday junction resolvase RusA-like endonuclease